MVACSHTSGLVSIKELSQQGPENTFLFLIDHNWITSHFLSKWLAQELLSLWPEETIQAERLLRNLCWGWGWTQLPKAHGCTEKDEDEKSDLYPQRRRNMGKIQLGHNCICYSDLSYEQQIHEYTVSETPALLSNLKCAKPIICTSHIPHCILKHFHINKSLVRKLGDVFHSFLSLYKQWSPISIT